MTALYAGELRRIDEMFPPSLEQAMITHGLLQAEVVPAARFIRACFQRNAPQPETSWHILG